MVALWIALAGVAGIVLGGVVVWFVIKNRANSSVQLAEKRISEATTQAQSIKESAKREAESAKKKR